MATQIIFNAANAAANQSAVVDLGNESNFSLHVKFSDSSIEGSLALSASNDASDWVSGVSSTSVVAGASVMLNVLGQEYRWVKIDWTASAGTGTMTGVLIMKEVNVVREI